MQIQEEAIAKTSVDIEASDMVIFFRYTAWPEHAFPNSPDGHELVTISLNFT